MRSIKIIWYTLMAASFIAGRLTGQREYFLLFFIMLFVVLYALALNLWTALSFSYLQELTLPAAVKGSAPDLRLGIYNDKPFPFTLMKVKVETVMPEKSCSLQFNLSPQSHINFTIPILCPYRGLYQVGMTTLEINDIFGLVKTRMDMRRLAYYRQKALKIFPRLVELPYLPAHCADVKVSGGGLGKVSEDGDTYSDLRRYRSGDSLKRVHKSVSARKRELYVKNYDIPLETAVLVAIDTASAGEGESGRYLADMACECAAAITSCSLRSGFSVELCVADYSSAPLKGRSQKDFPAIYDALATMQFGGKGDLGKILEHTASKAGNLKAAYIISSLGPAEYANALLKLRQEGCHVYCLRIAHTKERFDSDTAVPGVDCIVVTPGDDIRLTINS